MEEKRECCHTTKTKERTEKEYKDLIHRLNRIEGQVRGIKKMVESDTYCTDILIQVSAVNAALNSFSKVLLGNHIHLCGRGYPSGKRRDSGRVSSNASKTDEVK